MLRLAVIGKDVSASESPRMHAFLLQKMGAACSYEAISIPPERFAAEAEGLFARLDGFNVTIPYKAEILSYLRSAATNVIETGAANTVVTAARTGYNTDGFGFRLLLEGEGIDPAGKSALVLGAGGAGRSCLKALAEAGARPFAYEQDPARLTEAAKFARPLSAVPLRPFDLIVNCTGVGMHGTVGKLPAVRTETAACAEGSEEETEALLARCGTAVDLIYEPARSEFLRRAQKLGKRTVNGAAMLFYQAYGADCIFLTKRPDAEEARRLYREYLAT